MKSFSAFICLGVLAAGVSAGGHKPVVEAGSLVTTTASTTDPHDRNTHQGLHGKTRVQQPTGQPAVLGPFPGRDKQDLDSFWPELEPRRAYRLFKELGQPIPTDLARQFNHGLEATPWVESDRTAGNSPATALPIPDTSIGANFSDQDDTSSRSNYLADMPWGETGNGCDYTGDFAANDAWYVFTLDTQTQVYAGLCSDTFDYDTRLGIFSPNLEQVAGNDDNCDLEDLQSSLVCCLDPGTYYIVVDGYSTYSGEYELSVTFDACEFGPTPVAGGPDAFGDSWRSSDHPDGPSYSWQDTAEGTEIVLGDDAYTETPIDLPFDFLFYGTLYSQLYVGSNGILGFAAADMDDLSNTALPSSGTPDNLIAPFWDDLDPSAGGTITYLNEDWLGRVIVSYEDVMAYSGDVPLSFQVILMEGGDILFQYADLDENDLESATVGIENADGSVGMQCNLNGDGVNLADETCIRFNAPRATSGVDDATGYSWAHSDAVNGPAWEWVDISSETNLQITGDDDTETVILPWGFPYFGIDYVNVLVCSNGWLGFDVNSEAEYSNQSIPTAGDPDNAIFPFWEDLYPPSEDGAIYFWDDTANDRAIFQWDYISHIDIESEHVSFQVILYRSGDIVFQYGEMAESLLANATVGLENGDGSVGLQLLYNGSGIPLGSHQTVRFLAPHARPTRGSGDGYAWTNSLDATGPSHVWELITETGTALDLPTDDSQTAVTLPFPFPFFGSEYTALRVCSNGWLSFDETNSTDYNNQAIPTVGNVDNAIFPLWDDLDPEESDGAVYFQTDFGDGVDMAVFQWTDYPRHVTGGPYTFQVVLFPDGEILFHYIDMDDESLGSISVGVEGPGGTEGLEVNFDGTGSWITTGLTVSIQPVTTDVETPAVRPVSLELADAFPNPFNPRTTIGFSLAQAGPVQLRVYDIAGRLVSTLIDQPLGAGQHQARFDGSALPSGLYFYRLDTTSGSLTRKMMLVK